MAEKISCNSVRDLLPLYADHLLSPETEAEVKAHLEECAECREVYERMTAPEPEIPETGDEVDYLKKVRRKWKKAVVIAAAVIAVAAAATLAAFLLRPKGGPTVTYNKDSRTVVISGTSDYAGLKLPDEVTDAANLDVQDDSFHLSAYLPVFIPVDRSSEWKEFIPEYIDRTEKSLEFIGNYLKENAPEVYSEEQAGKFVDLSVRSGSNYSYSNDPDRICIELGSYYWHREELYLFALMDTETVEWPQLGYAWYLGLVLDPYYDMGNDGLDESSPVYEPYVKIKGDDKIESSEDWGIYLDATSYVCLTRGMYFGSGYESSPLSQTFFYTGPKNGSQGNKMSVFMAASFVSYLSDKYGFDKVTSFCFGREPFGVSFGTNFADAYADWSKGIIEKYGK